MATQSDQTGPSNTSKTLTGLGNLIKLLPTGTVFFYQFMNPILTNNGSCSSTNKIFSSLLFAVCGLSCFFSTFTDSYKDDQGHLHYGIATFNGFWPTSSDSGSTATSVDFKSYRLQVGDFVHALLSLTVFCVLSLLDSNTVHCFYPSFENTEKALLMALPPVIGSVAGAVFTTFPMRRRGVGYAESSASKSSPPSSTSTVAPAASGQQTPVQNV